MNPEERFGYFSYRPQHQSDTCKEISQELKDVLMDVVNYAFANKDTDKAIRKDIQRAETNRCELALDDILKPTPEWSGQWSKQLKSELHLLCYNVWQYFRQNQTLLDFSKKDEYVMFLNVVKVDPGARSQVRHKDFNFGDERHFYEMLFPLTDHPGQGGTNFGLSGAPLDFPNSGVGYYWNGHITHQGTANESDQTRYAFNIEMVAITDDVPLNKYQLNRYPWKCDNFDTVYIERREKGRDIGVIKDLELKEFSSDEEPAARPKTSSGAAGGGASAAPRQTASGGASVKVDRPKTAPARSIQDEIAASKAAAEKRKWRYYAKQIQEVGNGGGVESAPPESAADDAVDGETGVDEGTGVLEHQYRLFTYTSETPCDTCKEISQTMKDSLDVVVQYAFANPVTNENIKSDILYIFPGDGIDIQEAFPNQNRCELKLDDFLRPEPTWSTNFSKEERDYIRDQLETVCSAIFKTLKMRKLLDEGNIDKYVTIFNIIRVPDGSAAQPWHSDFKTEGAKRTHLYQAIFPLTDYDNQGGTNFNETGVPDFPPKGRGYFFDGFTGHKGTVNKSGRTRYALNAETFCVLEGVRFNDYQDDRYGLRCYDLATVHTRPKTSSRPAGGGASVVPDKTSAGGASAAPRPKSSGGASAAPHPKSSGGASAAPHPKSSGGIQDEIAARQAAEESRRNRYKEKQKQQVGGGGGAAPPMPDVIVISDDDNKGGGLGACIQLLHLRLLALESKHF